MKTTLAFYLISALLISPVLGVAQYSPGLPSAFGIDGDVLSGESQNISGNTSSGSFDWFHKPGGTNSNSGFGVVDTSGASYYGSLISQGANLPFTAAMAYARYSAVNGYLLLDTRYSRDNFAMSMSKTNNDMTTFTNGSKNGDNPSIWSTTPSGGSVADKDDIIDTYIHMRRDGTTINNTNPSHLILAMGVSTMGNTGNRYVDFELFRSRIAYDSITGVFSNSGPGATGGHSAWTFNANGSVASMGDMTVSFAYGTAGVIDISVYIWVANSDFSTTNPSTFKFVSGEYYGTSYGYAKIAPLSAGAFNAWGSTSTANTPAAPWGTNSKGLGSAPANYYSTSYAPYDFGEIGVDLTSLGIDPALTAGMNACSPPFTRVITKTRSSSSFTAALQDFTAPQPFLDAPQPSSQIAPPAALKCNVSTTVLSPAAPVSGASYQWSTTNGNILTDPNSQNITVNKSGTYYLTSSIVQGCPTTTDSTTVQSDYYKPIASATTSGTLILGDPTSFVTLVGGDVIKSNYLTPFGYSTGLNWNWSGPSGYASVLQSPVTTLTGTYTLVLTEQRNGCSDTAVTAISYGSRLLPIRFTAFSAVSQGNDKVKIGWTIEDTENGQLSLMRSFNGKNFVNIAQYNTLASSSFSQSFTDDISSRTGNTVFYKLRKTNVDGGTSFSSVLMVSAGNGTQSGDFSAAPNPATDYTVLKINSTIHAPATIQVVDMNGRIILLKTAVLEAGNNQVMFEGLDVLKPGMYLVRLHFNDSTLTEKLMKIK